MAKNFISSYVSIANDAKNYSRTQIIEGSTQLVNNFYDTSKQQALRQAIKDIRTLIYSQELVSAYHEAVQLFENQINAVKTYSIGNCHEYALLALEYMVKEKPEVFSEVYYIDGGDHVFLVIGREKNSNPEDPLTWGEHALICDPWADAVYPAKEYLTKTKNFIFRVGMDGRQYNAVQDFNPKRHTLKPLTSQNSERVLEGNFDLNLELIDYFVKINNKYCNIYQELADNFDKIANRLSKKYGSDNPNVTAIKRKTDEIRAEIDNIKSEVKSFALQIKNELKPHEYHSYKKTQIEVKNRLYKLMSKFDKTKALSGEEQENLSKHRKIGSFITLIMKFFNIKSASYRKYKASLKKAEKELSSNLSSKIMKK